ncbi:MAG: FecR domain-containing protein [Dysgonamonadaceae bacterium]|jgi:ferric-dicitrate binding protein FerR (iron transport regulator)|nr:FecR domain-containing protein [Dysgonamonadaceae bacterium]
MTDTKRIIPTEHYIYLTENNKTNFTLTDGTKIYLNKNSKLVYTNRYNETNRSVKMEGEAYFEVRHNPEKPFVVEAGDARIKVTGTSFNVKMDERADIRTTLTEGSIRFEMRGQQVILTPNQQLLYTDSSHRIDISSIDIDKELAWMEGVIRHKSVLFSDLMDGLMKQFRVRIVINNEQLKKSSVSMTGSFAEDQSLEQILNVIAITYPFTWEKRESVYYIK